MKRLLIAVVSLAPSCATKQKSVSKEVTSSKTEVHQHVLQNDTASATASVNTHESVSYAKWLKIYPKEKFSISEQGFIGAADSVIWYANYQQQESLAQRFNSTAASKTEINSVAKETKLQQQDFKQVEKSVFRWWPPLIFLGGLILCYCLLKGLRLHKFRRLL